MERHRDYKGDLAYYEALAERLKNVREKMRIEMVNQLTGGEEGGANEKIK